MKGGHPYLAVANPHRKSDGSLEEERGVGMMKGSDVGPGVRYE